MIVFVKHINKNYYKNRKTCAESWVKGILESGREIEIFDPDCRVGTHRRKRYIECYISIYGLRIDKRKNKENQTGKYIEKYIIPSIWLDYDDHLIKLYYDLSFSGIQTEDGIYLADPEDFKEVKVNDGEQILFRGSRYDLFCWHPYNK